jgi:hypothetical protein
MPFIDLGCQTINVRKTMVAVISQRPMEMILAVEVSGNTRGFTPLRIVVHWRRVIQALV